MDDLIFHAVLGHCQTSMMESFCENSWQFLAGKNFGKKLHHRCFERF